MSTNARIGLQLNGGIVSVYHHWDGYPQWLGVQLTTKYTNKEDIAELIDGGNMSCIASDTDWNRKECKEHVQYYTGRGESIDENAPKLAESMTEYFEQCDNCGAEYATFLTTVSGSVMILKLGPILSVNLLTSLRRFQHENCTICHRRFHWC